MSAFLKIGLLAFYVAVAENVPDRQATGRQNFGEPRRALGTECNSGCYDLAAGLYTIRISIYILSLRRWMAR